MTNKELADMAFLKLHELNRILLEARRRGMRCHVWDHVRLEDDQLTLTLTISDPPVETTTYKDPYQHEN